MQALKCKICGGDLKVTEGSHICECEYCGSIIALPSLTDKKTQLYNKATQFRLSFDFDKAIGLFNVALAEDATDAEIYWSLVLCKYGVAYVRDMNTGAMQPTCNRMQYTSIYGDPDYNHALEYASPEAADLYRAEAKKIDSIQRGMLDVSSKQNPFDVFICYKRSDASGDRTRDSLIAEKIYKALTQDGYRVFFAERTLEDKLGVQFEPYIFAALNSARIMIAVGTSAANLNSPWVKNEWSRFLALCAHDSKRVFIPAYEGMDPADFPQEFSGTQGQDMTKISAISDITHGVNNILGHRSGGAAAGGVLIPQKDRFLERGLQRLTDGKTNDARGYFEKHLDSYPDDYRAWWGLVRAETDDLKAIPYDTGTHYFDETELFSNYARAMDYAPDNERSTLSEQFEQMRKRDIKSAENKLAPLLGQQNKMNENLKQLSEKASKLQFELNNKRIESDAINQKVTNGANMPSVPGFIKVLIILALLYSVPLLLIYVPRSGLDMFFNDPEMGFVLLICIVVLIICLIVVISRKGKKRAAERLEATAKSLAEKVKSMEAELQSAERSVSVASNELNRFSGRVSAAQKELDWYKGLKG